MHKLFCYSWHESQRLLYFPARFPWKNSSAKTFDEESLSVIYSWSYWLCLEQKGNFSKMKEICLTFFGELERYGKRCVNFYVIKIYISCGLWVMLWCSFVINQISIMGWSSYIKNWTINFIYMFYSFYHIYSDDKSMLYMENVVRVY